jgi:hypothetical protein
VTMVTMVSHCFLPVFTLPSIDTKVHFSVEKVASGREVSATSKVRFLAKQACSSAPEASQRASSAHLAATRPRASLAGGSIVSGCRA